MARAQLAALVLLLAISSASANWIGYYKGSTCGSQGSLQCTNTLQVYNLGSGTSCRGITVDCFDNSDCQGSYDYTPGACAGCDDSGGFAKLTCTVLSTRNQPTTCTTPKPVGVCGDPHFSGPGDIQFDWHGKADNDFSLISDTNLQVNAHFIGERKDTEKIEHGTWIQEISVGYKDPVSREDHFLSVGIDQEKEFEASDVFYFTYDGEDIPLDSGTAMYTWTSPDGMATLIREPHQRAEALVKIEGLFEAVLLPRVESRIQLEPLGKYLDMDIQSMTLSRHSHGVLGQMFRPDAIERKNAATNETKGHEFMVEGKVEDYQVSSLRAYDSVFNQFNQEPSVSVKKVNLIDTSRKMLGSPDMEDASGNFRVRCVQQQGSLFCV